MTHFMTRRRFIQSAGIAALAAGPLLRTNGRAAASERIRIAYIGCGGRARQMMPMFGSFPDVEVAAISDVLEPRMAQSIEVLGKCEFPQKAESVVEYERILERKDVDAVIIATTQHWHGLPHILACQAGKHIFVEKPLSHTVTEGREMVKATHKYGITAMMGTQQRAGPHYQKAVQMVQEGRLGKVGLVECWNYHNSGNRVGRHPDAEVPAGCHWDRWLGPAPWAPYNPGRLNNSWWFDYSGGMLTNWAIHHIDIILWAMKSWSPESVSCSGGKFVVNDMADTPDTIEASWQFPDWLMQYHYRGFNNFHSVQSRPNHHGIIFHGNRAALVLDRFGYEIWEDADPKKVAEQSSALPYFDAKNPSKSEQDGPWHRLFIDCIKSGKQPPLDLEESHKGTVCCHLANISYLAGRSIKWNGQTENIAGDPEAARLLSRPRRKNYDLPKI